MRREFPLFGVDQPMRIIGRSLMAMALAAPMFGCTQVQTTGQSPSFLIIDAMRGSSGASPTQFSGFLESDVVTNGGVFEDAGQVAFRLAMKDPGTPSSPTTPSSTNFITVNRYRVEFVRSDGRNTPGVDVPFPFDGGLTVTVGASGATGSLVLVRAQAKLEAPLRALATGGAGVISTIAQVTFYGMDQAGREVSVTGNLSVNFANWADPSAGGD
jgi:hypothetical protein